MERAARNPIATGAAVLGGRHQHPVAVDPGADQRGGSRRPQIVDAKGEGAGGELLDQLRCAVIGIQGDFGKLNLQLGRDFLGRLYWRAVGFGPDVGGLR